MGIIVDLFAGGCGAKHVDYHLAKKLYKTRRMERGKLLEALP